ncbi:MAG: hypothetical protein J0H06_03330 [Actinobacteria bacterium]|nr:hypothetical protein [Actinomycetota bacterium]OJU80994.1 MAG: hypothetical protein BGO11_21230 [Solirubrobacterales bacterium 70-9]
MIPFAQIVEIDPLLEAIWTSVAFGLGVLVIAAIGVRASLRAAEQRGEHHEGAFASYGFVTIFCGLLLVAAVVLGIWAMTQ